jgi:hypothetical protein
MCGEFLRETAVLILVFVPLELHKPGSEISLKWFLAIVLFSVMLLVSGMILERIRP